MRIPMRGKIGSLNAAVAGSILLFEAVEQRLGASPETAPAPETELAPEKRTRARRAKAVLAEAAPEQPVAAEADLLPDVAVLPPKRGAKRKPLA
jgi:hypothetical protein